MVKYIIKKGDKYYPSPEMKKIAWVSSDKIYKDAEKNPIKFWEKLAGEGITWEKKWTKAYVEKLPYFEWFKGGKLNFCVNCLDRHLEKRGNELALIWIGEPVKEKPVELTYKQLHEKVCKFANVLKKHGIKKQDVVSIYLPMIPEALIAMLACTRIGAIHSVVFSAFSAEALQARIKDGKAKILITADGYFRRGEKIDLLTKAKQGAKATSAKKIIVVGRLKKKISGKGLLDFNTEINKQSSKCEPEIMNSEDIMFILYTSGCCHGNSLIQLSNGEINKIKDLVDRNTKSNILNISLNPPTQTTDKITCFHRYPTNSIMYKIRTPSFEAVFTPNHRIFSLNEYGDLIEKKAGNLNMGDKIFVISKINIRGEKQRLPLLKQKEDYKNKTTYRPENIPKIPEFLTPGFAQILGYLTGDGHADNRSIIFTDKDKNNLIFYQNLIENELGLRGVVKKIDRQRLHINSSLFTNYIKEVFLGIVCKSRNRSVSKIIQKSENECIAGFLRGLFDAEGTIGHSFIKLSSTSEELVRTSQLLMRRLGILGKVYGGINKERNIGNHKIKETSYLDLIISERGSLNLFYEKIGFSDEAKKLRLERLMKNLSSKRIFSKDRFPIFSLLKELTKTIKIDWRNEFSKITKYVYSNQIDKGGLRLVRNFLDEKIKTETNEEKLSGLKSIRDKIQKLMEFEGVVLEKVLEVNKVDNEHDFVYDLTAKNNHNYIVNGFITHNTTGTPKGIIHDTGGYAVQAYWTTKYNFNLHEEDIMWCTADVGWITGHTYAFYGPLLNGSTSLIYEGSPDFPDMGRWWKIIDDNKVSVLYTAPTAIRMFMKAGNKWLKKYNLNSLKILGTVGEPIDEDAWDWYLKKIGKGRCPIIDTWWQTETGGTLINALPGIGPFIPTVAGKSFPGTRHLIVNEKAKPVKKGKTGILVQASPFAPGMLHGIYNNPKRYKKTYWRFKKYYDTSDGAYEDKYGNIRITGRTDDIMKVAGHRLSTAEVENAIAEDEKVSEAAVVGIPDKIKGEVPIAFVVLKKDKPSKVIEKEIIKDVDREIGPTARPAKIYFIDDLPKTRSGKIMRRILKALLIGEKPKGLQTLLNPKAVDKIKTIISKK